MYICFLTGMGSWFKPCAKDYRIKRIDTNKHHLFVKSHSKIKDYYCM